MVAPFLGNIGLSIHKELNHVDVLHIRSTVHNLSVLLVAVILGYLLNWSIDGETQSHMARHPEVQTVLDVSWHLCCSQHTDAGDWHGVSDSGGVI